MGPKTREGHISIRYFLLTTVIHTQKINIFPPGVMVANILSMFRNNLSQMYRTGKLKLWEWSHRDLRATFELTDFTCFQKKTPGMDC